MQIKFEADENSMIRSQLLRSSTTVEEDEKIQKFDGVKAEKDRLQTESSNNQRAMLRLELQVEMHEETIRKFRVDVEQRETENKKLIQKIEKLE